MKSFRYVDPWQNVIQFTVQNENYHPSHFIGSVTKIRLGRPGRYGKIPNINESFTVAKNTCVEIENQNNEIL
jgi:hypothetical protein